ncbi:MAG: hypothetical protein ACI8PZ_001882 [Myxococcota bacterium]|jgi:hypothetical protein
MRWTVLAALSLLALPGCHAKFKRAAPAIGAVEVQVLTHGGPSVSLGRVNTGDGLVDAVVNITQVVGESHTADRLAAAVDMERTNAALEQGLADTLATGHPFPVSDSGDATLQLEVVDYGLETYALGAPASFDYDIRVRIYDGTERVYSARTRCDTAAGAPPPLASAIGVVNNRRQVERMEDAEIQAAFDAVAEWCGQQVVRKMRKHAG